MINIYTSILLKGKIPLELFSISFLEKYNDSDYETSESKVYRFISGKFKLEVNWLKKSKIIKYIMLEEIDTCNFNKKLYIKDDVSIFSLNKKSSSASNVKLYFDDETGLCESFYVFMSTVELK
jgi:hypothetical protein